MNLIERVVEVHRQPEDGRYSQVRRAGADGFLDMIALPGITMPAADILHPAAGY